MLALSLFLALVIDRIAPALQGYREGYQLQNYAAWLLKQPLFTLVPPRLLPYFLIMPPLILVIVLGNFARFSGFFELGFNIFIAFICLRPQVLNEEVDDAIKALESSDSYLQLDIDKIFFYTNRNLFSVVFWMVVAGPIWAVGYRLLDNMLTISEIPEREKWQIDVYRIVSWIEWLPALISSYVFMLCGNFEAGIKASRNISLLAGDIGELNETRLRKTGLAVVQASTTEAGYLTADTLRRSRGMLLRTLVVWLMLAGLVDYWL